MYLTRILRFSPEVWCAVVALYCGFFRFSPIWWWWLGAEGFFWNPTSIWFFIIFISWDQSASYASLLILSTGFCLLQLKFSGNATILLTSFSSIFNSLSLLLFLEKDSTSFHYSSLPHFEESENFFYSCGDWEYLSLGGFSNFHLQNCSSMGFSPFFWFLFLPLEFSLWGDCQFEPCSSFWKRKGEINGSCVFVSQ